MNKFQLKRTCCLAILPITYFQTELRNPGIDNAGQFNIYNLKGAGGNEMKCGKVNPSPVIKAWLIADGTRLRIPPDASYLPVKVEDILCHQPSISDASLILVNLVFEVKAGSLLQTKLVMGDDGERMLSLSSNLLFLVPFYQKQNTPFLYRVP